MSQLELLKAMLLISDATQDTVLNFCLDCAKNIICDIRNSDNVEPKYQLIQIKIAVEIYNKMGAEGQVSHSENGISRGYEVGDISLSLISQITPMMKTPFTSVRTV